MPANQTREPWASFPASVSLTHLSFLNSSGSWNSKVDNLSESWKPFFFVSEAIRWSVIRVLNLSIYSNPMILPPCYWHNYLVVGLRVIQFTRRNHSAKSNALLVELIERLGSVKFGNRTQSKSHQKILAIEPSRTLIEFDTVRWSKFSIRLKVGRYTGK